METKKNETFDELRKKMSFWNREIEKELKRYEKIIVERVVEMFEEEE